MAGHVIPAGRSRITPEICFFNMLGDIIPGMTTAHERFIRPETLSSRRCMSVETQPVTDFMDGDDAQVVERVTSADFCVRCDIDSSIGRILLCEIDTIHSSSSVDKVDVERRGIAFQQVVEIAFECNIFQPIFVSRQKGRNCPVHADKSKRDVGRAKLFIQDLHL